MRSVVLDTESNCDNADSNHKDREPSQELSEEPQHPVPQENEYKGGNQTDQIHFPAVSNVSGIGLQIVQAKAADYVVVGLCLVGWQSGQNRQTDSV